MGCEMRKDSEKKWEDSGMGKKRALQGHELARPWEQSVQRLRGDTEVGRSFEHQEEKRVFGDRSYWQT